MLYALRLKHKGSRPYPRQEPNDPLHGNGCNMSTIGPQYAISVSHLNLAILCPNTVPSRLDDVRYLRPCQLA